MSTSNLRRSFLRPEIETMPGYTPGEQHAHGKYIKLNTNENPYPPSPHVTREICAALEQGLQRYPDPSALAFRERAAEILGVQPDWILCGNGSDDVLTIVTRAFVSPGDLVRFPRPSYLLYRTLAQLQGARYEEVAFQPDWSLGDDFCQPARDLRLAFLANPNSPSGTLIPPQRVLQIAKRLACPLLVDEAYADFAEGNCLRLLAESQTLMVSRSLSKSYALAGLRFGFLVARPSLITHLNKVKDSYNCDRLSIAGAVAAIHDQVWLTENRAKILATRDWTTRKLRELGFAVVESQANFVWCQHPTRAAFELYTQLKDRHRILVRHMDYPGWGDGLRISIGTDDQMQACVDTLRALL